jgi:hypothetical protein
MFMLYIMPLARRQIPPKSHKGGIIRNYGMIRNQGMIGATG